MASMTRAFFDGELARLRCLRFVPSDTDPHYEDLQAIPESVFTAAVTLARRTRLDFPVPAELRADCDQVASQVRRPVPVREPWDDCTVCRDSGWRWFWCGCEDDAERDERQVLGCGRRDHPLAWYPHSWVRACECRATNPTLLRQQAARAKYAEEKVAVRKSRG
jgi:hypothetical protein